MGLINGSGRVGRLNYFAIGLAIGLATVFVLYLGYSEHPITGEPVPPNPGLLIGVIALYYWLTIANMIRRLHDCGHSGWVGLLSLVPFLNIGLSLYLLFKRGDPGRNSFGWPPGKTEMLDKEAHRARMEQIMATSGEAYSGRAVSQAANQQFSGGWDE